jgi:hypothetical protein
MKNLKQEDWRLRCALEDSGRASANKLAMEASQAKAQAEAEARKLEKAREGLAAGSQAYQLEQAPIIEKAMEKAQRQAQKEGRPGGYSCFGHRLGSEGAQMDQALEGFHRAFPEKAYPDAKSLKDYAGKAGFAFPYAINRIRGHLNHLLSKHNESLPAAYKQKIKS